ncbi:hypothetical protein MKZ38_008394 [Zalerion maritima]|uniref:Uncharacterized protein n=1 Tax=Zalerion maritima TaxID=339359 RepID=A0AAD5WMH3_9PEZI|nr:hypothetical protein MKZ38_008394 [Zalerion maritima]
MVSQGGENKNPSTAMSFLIPDRRRENPKLPPPSQYRRPPKLAKRRAKTDPPSSYDSHLGSRDEELLPYELQTSFLKEASQESSQESSNQPDDGSIKTSSSSVFGLRRARTVHHDQQRRPSFPIIYRPTASPSPAWRIKQEPAYRTQGTSAESYQSLGPGHSDGKRTDILHQAPDSDNECYDNVGSLPRRSFHQRSNSVPSRQLRLASCPELLRRTHSQGHDSTIRDSPPLHPLSRNPDNENSLAQLYRKLRGILHAPLHDVSDMGSTLTRGPQRRRGHKLHSEHASFSGDHNPLHPTPVTNPISSAGRITPLALSRERLKSFGSSSGDPGSHAVDIEDTGSIIHTPFSGVAIFDLEAQAIRELESFVNNPDDGDTIKMPSPRRYHQTEPPYSESILMALDSSATGDGNMSPGGPGPSGVPQNTPASDKPQSTIRSVHSSKVEKELTEAIPVSPLGSLIDRLSLEAEESGGSLSVTPAGRKSDMRGS